MTKRDLLKALADVSDDEELYTYISDVGYTPILGVKRVQVTDRDNDGRLERFNQHPLDDANYDWLKSILSVR